MGILDRIFGKRDDSPAEPEQKPEFEPECPHTALAPHWANPADMGKNELATYTCESCGETFAYAQAKEYLEKPPAVLTATRDSE